MFEAAQDADDVIKRYHRIETLFRQLQNDVSLRTWRGTNRQHVILSTLQNPAALKKHAFTHECSLFHTSAHERTSIEVAGARECSHKIASAKEQMRAPERSLAPADFAE